MKVCYVTHLPNLTGASQSLLDLLRALEGTEVEPIVLLNRHGLLEDELKARGVPYRVIRFANELKKDDSKLHTIRKDALNAHAKAQLKAFLQAQGVELVHNNSMFVGLGMECAKELRIPYIAHIRDYVEEDHGLRLEHPKAQRRRVQEADAAIAVSKTLAKVAEQKYGAPASGILPLYDGIDVERYYIAPDARKQPLSGDTVELLLAGRIAPGKGQLDAAKAVEKLNREDPRYHLTIVGSVGSEAYAEELNAYIESLPDGWVTVTSFVNDLKLLRAQTDIALVCSSHEAMGRVTIESLLSGCLVVGANGGATSELLAEGRGVLYNPGYIDGLVKSIRIVSNYAPEEVHTCVRQGQSFALKTFSLEQYAAEILNIYRQVLS